MIWYLQRQNSIATPISLFACGLFEEMAIISQGARAVWSIERGLKAANYMSYFFANISFWVIRYLMRSSSASLQVRNVSEADVAGNLTN